jgi:hypothetical protein
MSNVHDSSATLLSSVFAVGLYLLGSHLVCRKHPVSAAKSKKITHYKSATKYFWFKLEEFNLKFHLIIDMYWMYRELVILAAHNFQHYAA